MSFRLRKFSGSVLVIVCAIGIGFFWGSWNSAQLAQAAVVTSNQEGDFTALDAYKAGIKKLWEEGPEAAELYLDEEMNNFGDLKVLYGKAHIQYTKLEYESAEKKFRYILSHENEPLLHAVCNYSIGLIRHFTDRPEEALEYYKKALEYFDEVKYFSNAYRCHIQIAHIYVLNNDIKLAGLHLNKAYNIHENINNNLGTFYKVKTSVAFMERKFLECREFSRSSLQEYRIIGNEPGVASALSDVGLFEILLGHAEAGRGLTIEAQEMLVTIDLANDERVNYNNINFLLLSKCGGDQEYIDLIASINSYISKSGDKNLKDLLDFAIQWDCQHKESNNE